MRTPVQWLRDKRDPFSDLEPMSLDDIFNSDSDSEEDEMDTSLRDAIEEFYRVTSEGGPQAYMSLIEERAAYESMTISLEREAKTLWWNRVGIASSVAFSCASFVVSIIALNASN